MESLQDKSDELIQLITENYGNIGIHSGVPFIIYHYPPEQEKEMIKEIQRITTKIENKEIICKKLRLDQEFKELTQEYLKDLGGLDYLYGLEKENRETLRRELATDIKQEIIKKIIKKSEGETKRVTLIYRTGAIHPIIRIHTLLMALEKQIKNPLIIFYPGSYDGKKLRFLNKNIAEEGYYYRARII